NAGPDVSGAMISLGFNLIGNGTGSIGLTDGFNGDKVGTATNPINPLLAALANNGGSTQTQALLTGSPAIDAIPVASCAVNADQRGVARPQGNGCDIGAFEASFTAQQNIAPAVTATAPPKTTPTVQPPTNTPATH